jgi:hypothetical protein
MNYLSHIVHYAIVPSVEKTVQFYRFTCDVLDSLGEIGDILLKLVLHLFGADRLMNISLQIDLFTIVILCVIELQIIHRLVRLIFLVDSVSHRHVPTV